MEEDQTSRQGVVAKLKSTRLPDGYDEDAIRAEPVEDTEDILNPAEAKAADYHARRMDAIRGSFQPRIETAKERLDNETERWEEIRGDEDRLPRYSSQWFYWPFMAVLAIGEVPLNKLSFELFFQESPLMSLVVAAVIGLVLIALAHRIGVVLRHFRYNGQRGSYWVQAVQAVVLVAITGALIYGVSVLRQGYIAFVTQPELGFAELLQNNQVGEIAQIVLTTGLGAEGWIFLLINAAILLVGISAAFFCHDPHPDFEKVDRLRKSHEKELMKVRHALADKQAAELRRYASVRHRLKQG